MQWVEAPAGAAKTSDTGSKPGKSKKPKKGESGEGETAAEPKRRKAKAA
jgi:hypothetical protein